MASPHQLRQTLSRVQALLADARPLLGASAEGVAERLSQRVRRDLLPRLGGGEAPTLLVGIAGPNNVGKSSLFNALVGRPLSPARAEAGLTKQCLAVAAPAVWEGDLRGLLESRYEVVLSAPGDLAVVGEPGPPGRLYLLLDAAAPPGVLLMDTPDFDSVFLRNRANAEALLVTVDLVVFVLSRQTYQNAAVVDFLKDAVGHGRPYALVYNEAPERSIATGHLRVLAAQVGTAPVATYLAGHQPEVEQGRALLQTTSLDGAPALRALLSEPTNAAPLKARALAASLAGARKELGQLAAAAREVAKEPDRLRLRIRRELQGIGERAARRSVPADVLISAFQDELDARSTFNRVVRRQVRRVETAVTWVGRKVRESFMGPDPAPRGVAEATRTAMDSGLRGMIEALAPEAASWRGDAETRALVRQAFGPEALNALAKADALPDPDPQRDRQVLYAFCRSLVARELERGNRQAMLQTATTLVYSVPAGAAGVLSFATGGLGHDVAVWVAAAASTPVLEALVDLLGRGIRDEVTGRWAEEHGATLAQALAARHFGPLLERLDGLVEQAEALAAGLEQARGELDAG